MMPSPPPPKTVLAKAHDARVTRTTFGFRSTPQQARFVVGLIALLIAIGLGVALNLQLWSAANFFSSCSFRADSQPMLSLVFAAAYVPVGLYLLVPKLVDRFDPEPWWALLGVFLFGAAFATGLAGWTHRMLEPELVGVLGSRAASVASVVSVSPAIEELGKAGAIWGMVFFVRREFDGIVDGVIYATFVAVGFAATENVVYYATAYCSPEAAAGLGRVFFARGVLTPWLHPLFTVMTGLGFGLAREHGGRWARVVLPLSGLLAAIFLHTLWNAIVATAGTDASGMAIAVGTAMAASFIYLLLTLVRRKGRIIRDFLADEVALGHLRDSDVTLISSPAAMVWSWFANDRRRRRAFIRAGNRLAMCKWHVARAVRTGEQTISSSRIDLLRKQLLRLRGTR